MPLPAVRPWCAAGFCVDWFAGRFVGLLVCCLVDWFAGVGWLCRLWLVACFAFQFGRICNPGAFFSRFVICHALRYRVLAICCLPRRSSTSGSKNHRTALYCLRPTPPRTASLLSGNSVLRADFFRRRLTPPRLVSVFQRFCAGHARGEPSAELPAARVRRTAADY